MIDALPKKICQVRGKLVHRNPDWAACTPVWLTVWELAGSEQNWGSCLIAGAGNTQPPEETVWVRTVLSVHVPIGPSLRNLLLTFIAALFRRAPNQGNSMLIGTRKEKRIGTFPC